MAQNKNNIDLGTITVDDKNSTLTGKKINLNLQLKITYNPNDEDSIKVEMVNDNQPKDSKLIKNNSANVDKLNISQLLLETFPPQIYDPEDDMIVNTIEKDDYDDNDDAYNHENEREESSSVDFGYTLVKQNLEKDKANSKLDDN